MPMAPFVVGVLRTITEPLTHHDETVPMEPCHGVAEVILYVFRIHGVATHTLRMVPPIRFRVRNAAPE